MAVSGAGLFADYVALVFIVDDLREFHLAVALFRLLTDVIDAEH